MNGDEKPVGVAVLGLGNVGSEVVRIIEDSADDLAARIGAPLVLQRFPDRFVNGRGALLAFAGTSVVLAMLLFLAAKS